MSTDEAAQNAINRGPPDINFSDLHKNVVVLLGVIGQMFDLLAFGEFE